MTTISVRWYLAYLSEFGGIISDTEHLEGGYRLWRSFIKTASRDSRFNIKLVDQATEEVLIDKVTTDTPKEELWSTYTKEEKDRTHENRVLVLEKSRVAP